MSRIALLTPDPADTEYAQAWPRVLDVLASALAGEGLVPEPVPWTQSLDAPERLRDFALVLPLLTWGYHHAPAAWRRACAGWAAAGVRMANPAPLLAWNSDKHYLAELAARGVPLPDTHYTRRLDAGVLAEAFERTGAEELIVKPAVSGGAWCTWRLRRGELPDAAALAGVDGIDMLVQPYLPSIETEGETSLLFFDGVLGHVVNKRPVSGEFRVQEEFGGQYRRVEAPPAGVLALAQSVLAAIDAPTLYARIDCVPDAQGQWLLMEAELVEPDLYLRLDPGGGARFAAAVRRWAERA